MGALREAEHLLPQASELYRRSLALEDSSEIRASLARAGGHAVETARPETVQKIDPALRPGRAQFAGFSADEIRHFTAREDFLRPLLARSFQDWGTLLARQQQYASALEYFHEAEDWDAATPGLMHNIGTAAFRLGQYQEAARAFDLASLRDDKDRQARLMLAMSQFSLDRFADAAQSFASVEELASQDPRAAYAWALSLARTDRQEKANTIVDSLSTQALPSEQMSLVCKVYDTTANYEQAVKCFRRISQTDPLFKGSHLEVGAALIRLDRPSEAIPEVQEELRLNPEDRDAQYYLAYAYLQVSRKDEAAALLEAIVKADPGYVQAQYQLGKLMLERGETEQAVSHLEAAAKEDRSHDYLHYQLEVAYRRAGRIADADRELKLYKEIKASHREIAPQEHDKTE